MRNPANFNVFAFWTLILVAFAGPGRAANIYVGVAGDDSNPGTEQMPFRTIQHAADAAQPGDVIRVGAGTYRELVTTELLGKAVIPDLRYEQPNGEPISISTDYFGNNRNESNPAPGPFESAARGRIKVRVW